MISRTMVFNDPRIPFHDVKSLDLVLDIFEDLDLDRMVINGDLLDFYNVNSHGPKHPDISTNLEDELIAGREFFEGLRERFPKKEIVFIFGNHEDRLDRFIVKNSKQLWGLLTLENFINFDRLNIEYHHYNYRYQLENTNCFIQHSPPSYGQNGARTSLLSKPNATFIYGCTHRVQHSCNTDAHGNVHSVYFNGWLGSTTDTKEHTRVFSYAKGHQNWQQAFCIVTVEGGEQFHINQYLIRDHKVVVDGSLYEG